MASPSCSSLPARAARGGWTPSGAYCAGRSRNGLLSPSFARWSSVSTRRIPVMAARARFTCACDAESEYDRESEPGSCSIKKLRPESDFDISLYSVFERSMSLGLTRGWNPVRVKKTRHIKKTLEDEPAQIGILGQIPDMLLDISGVDADRLAFAVRGRERDVVEHPLHDGLQPSRTDVLHG